MLTIDEFNRVASACQRKIVISVVLSGILAFAFLGAMLLFRDPIYAFLAREFGAAAADDLMGLVLLPALIVLFRVIWAGWRRANLDPRVRCPHCDKLLANMRSVVVATRNCGHCGRRILADPDVL